MTRTGWGDLELGAVYALPVDAVNLSLSGSVKLPTAENNLGTGETDYTIGADVSKACPTASFPSPASAIRCQAPPMAFRCKPDMRQPVG